MNKDQLLAWAFSVLKERIDQGTYGAVVITMQNGVIGHIKTEISEKPPIELSQKNA